MCKKSNYEAFGAKLPTAWLLAHKPFDSFRKAVWISVTKKLNIKKAAKLEGVFPLCPRTTTKSACQVYNEKNTKIHP